MRGVNYERRDSLNISTIAEKLNKVIGVNLFVFAIVLRSEQIFGSESDPNPREKSRSDPKNPKLDSHSKTPKYTRENPKFTPLYTAELTYSAENQKIHRYFANCESLKGGNCENFLEFPWILGFFGCG